MAWRQTIALWVAGALALVAGWAALIGVTVGFPCGGDGGEAYARRGSDAYGFCHHGGQPLVVLLPLAGVLAGWLIARRRAPAEWGWWIALGLLLAGGIDAAIVVLAHDLDIHP